MSDLDLNQRNTSKKREAPSTERLKDQMQGAAAEMKDRAGDALQASTDAARDKVAEAADTAKGVASDAVDQFQNRARDKQQSGADFIGRFAGNIREAARAFENDAPFAAKGLNSAAEYVEGASEQIRNGSFRDLVDGASGFAKRQPAAFLGLSVLAGFAVVRLLRASDGGAPSQQGSDQSASPRTDQTWAGGSGNHNPA
jgi:gas vesicle protein